MQKIAPFLWFDTQAAKKAKRVMEAMLKMKKIDIAALKAAAEAAS